MASLKRRAYIPVTKRQDVAEVAFRSKGVERRRTRRYAARAMPISPPLLITGASARAAAASASCAGWRPMAIDLFCDADLEAHPQERVAQGKYPSSIARLAHAMPPGPWMYTGGLENHPALVDAITQERELLGNPGAVLRRARDPMLFEAVLRREGLPALRTCAAGVRAPKQGDWLKKPLCSAGGHGIERWESAGAIPRGFYLQEVARGECAAAVFVTNGAGTRLLGVSEQLVGLGALHARPFAHCGSIAPLHLPAAARSTIERQGEVLAHAFGLRGLFGLDIILCDGVPLPLEINPRWTASVETIEAAAGLNLFALHAAAFGLGAASTIAPATRCEAVRSSFQGRAILFASERVVVTEDLRASARIADVPHPGETIDAGRPVVTIFAEADSADACRRALIAFAEAIERRLVPARGIGIISRR